MDEKQPHDLIDETIHQRTRLAIMATLAGVDRWASSNSRPTWA